MRRSEALDQFFALLGESEEDFAPVRGSDHADDSIAKDELVNNADRAVVADLQLLSEVADGEFLHGELRGEAAVHHIQDIDRVPLHAFG